MDRGAAPFAPVHIDLIYHNICRHLSARDLCRMMGVSKEWLLAFVTDAAWEHLKRRVLSVCPEWGGEVFDVFKWRASGEEKKRDVKRAKLKRGAKRAIIMPVGGTWYVVRRFISPLTSVAGIKSLCSYIRTTHTAILLPRKRAVVDAMKALFLPYVRMLLVDELKAGITFSECVFNGGRKFWFRCTFRVGDGSEGVQMTFPCGYSDDEADLIQIAQGKYLVSPVMQLVLRMRCMLYDAPSSVWVEHYISLSP
jgi:hypothetical protein